jgi:hypothetical protein
VGLFDEVRCEYPLPNAAHQGLLFQTKDLENLMDEYVITRRGRLVRTKRWLLEPRSCRVVCPIHQDLRIHDSVVVGPDEREWVEYVFRFTEGRVTGVRRSRDRRRFKVARSGPEPRTPSEAPAVGPAEGETKQYLVPGLHARRPTVDEFSSYTPERLELIDGHIPGEEDLLLLLLTSMGLSRAAELVGPRLWRSAAAPLRWTPAPSGARRRKKGNLDGERHGG